MEPIQETNKRTITLASAVFGLYIGVVLIAFDIILWMVSAKGTSLMQNFNIILLVAGIVLAIRFYRDKDLQGYISYKNALKMGTLLSFFASLILGFDTYVLLKFIDPSLMQVILDASEKLLIESGRSDAEVEMMMTVTQQVTTPFILLVSTIFSITFWGALFSLLIAFLLRKEKSVFDNDDTTIINQ